MKEPTYPSPTEAAGSFGFGQEQLTGLDDKYSGAIADGAEKIPGIVEYIGAEQQTSPLLTMMGVVEKIADEASKLRATDTAQIVGLAKFARATDGATGIFRLIDQATHELQMEQGDEDDLIIGTGEQGNDILHAPEDIDGSISPDEVDDEHRSTPEDYLNRLKQYKQGVKYLRGDPDVRDQHGRQGYNSAYNASVAAVVLSEAISSVHETRGIVADYVGTLATRTLPTM